MSIGSIVLCETDFFAEAISYHLVYHLVESELILEGETIKTYGFRVHLRNDSTQQDEITEIRDISTDKSDVIDLGERLSALLVTPTTLPYIIEDLL